MKEKSAYTFVKLTRSRARIKGLEPLMVLYVFLADHHSGQRSRGYRLLSRVCRAIERRCGERVALSSSCFNSYRRNPLYDKLVKKYAIKM